MSRLTHRLQKKFFWVAGVLLVAPLAWAQHTARAAAGPHYSGPPISRAPLARPTTLPAPLFRAPVYWPRIGAPPSPTRFGPAVVHVPWHPIRRFPPVLFFYGFPIFTGPWGFNSCWAAACDYFWPWTFDYTTVYASGTANYLPPEYQPPAYDYGLESPSLPQLYLKDGSVLNVTDYWLVDNQLHFTMIEDDEGEAQEHVIPFELLDLDKTKQVSARRGFHFMLRDEPVEQYMRDHPDGPPATPQSP